MKTPRLIRRLSILMGLVVLCMVAWGHEEPEEEIAELTEQMKFLGENSELLLQRAIEYRVIGKLTEASRDLEMATRLTPSNLHAQRELAKVYFTLGKTNEAVDSVGRVLKTKIEDPIEIASLRIVRAEFLKARGDYKKALDDAEEAIKLHKTNVEWYLLRGDIHEKLNQPKQRISSLEEGIRETGSGMLEIELVEALIDAKEFSAALAKIEPELKASRIQSSWLIRRAQARLGLGEKSAAKLDLEAAIEEMNRRLQVTSHDVTLLTDEGRARELLGDKEEAKHYYELARDAGAEEWVKEKLKAFKAEEDAKSESKDKEKDKDKEADKEKKSKADSKHRDKEKDNPQSPEKSKP